uniref:Uncharacterized protein n=1 Tax=Anguilla anguilla TaxID=7936 RepID=A0A0E9TG10_ANGAN
MFAALFPHDPQFVGRQVATFHNLARLHLFQISQVHLQEREESWHSRARTTLYT